MNRVFRRRDHGASRPRAANCSFSGVTVPTLVIQQTEVFQKERPMTNHDEKRGINAFSDGRAQATRAQYAPWDGSDFLEVNEEYEDFDQEGNLVQWTTPDRRRFVAAGQSQAKLPPGVY